MKPGDSDLELLSAYHDGELALNERREMKRRLRREPALRAALADIAEVSGALQAMRPAISIPRAANRMRWRFGSGAAAAAIAVAIVGFGLHAPENAIGDRTALEWHDNFLTRTYEPSEAPRIIPVAQWISQAPDLASANLRLVDFGGDATRGAFLHYAGQHGCRLTFGIHPALPEMPAPDLHLLSAGWATETAYYSLIADGMDAGKFNAIAHLLEEQTRERHPSDATVLALREATGNAAPCA